MLSWSILQYFWPALSDNRSWKPIFGPLFEWLLKTGLTAQPELHHKTKTHYKAHTHNESNNRRQQTKNHCFRTDSIQGHGRGPTYIWLAQSWPQIPLFTWRKIQYIELKVHYKDSLIDTENLTIEYSAQLSASQMWVCTHHYIHCYIPFFINFVTKLVCRLSIRPCVHVFVCNISCKCISS